MLYQKLFQYFCYHIQVSNTHVTHSVIIYRKFIQIVFTSLTSIVHLQSISIMTNTPTLVYCENNSFYMHTKQVIYINLTRIGLFLLYANNCHQFDKTSSTKIDAVVCRISSQFSIVDFDQHTSISHISHCFVLYQLVYLLCSLLCYIHCVLCFVCQINSLMLYLQRVGCYLLLIELSLCFHCASTCSFVLVALLCAPIIHCTKWYNC